MTFDFQLLTKETLPLLVEWLNKPHVEKWWREPATLASATKEYGACIDGSDPTNVYIVYTEQTPIAMIQSYYNVDYPEHDITIQLDHSVGIDIFIGEEAYVGKGYGPAMLSAFVQTIIPKVYPDAVCVVADPELANPRSIRSFQKAGFKKGRTTPGEYGPEQLMIYEL